MTGCGRQWCTKCGEETIHRDNRHGYESASCLGQITWREGPKNISLTDVDMLSRKGLRNGMQLLLGVEQKQPQHKFSGTPQERTLRLLDAAIRHCGLCPEAVRLRIDPRSGIYLVTGPLGAATESRRKTMFLGSQEIKSLSTEWKFIADVHETFFRFLDPEDLRRRDRDEDHEAS